MHPPTANLAPLHYSKAQIALHWIVAALIVVQWITHDAMEDFWDAVEHGEAGGLPEGPTALIHLGSGATILVLMLARALTRLRFGAPPLPSDLPRIIRLAAHLNHFAFYVLLIATPLAGLAAVFLRSDDAADLHGTLVWLLILLIGLHVAAVIYHTFVRRDGLIWRMLVAR
jgi:cytochrome b561